MLNLICGQVEKRTEQSGVVVPFETCAVRIRLQRLSGYWLYWKFFVVLLSSLTRIPEIGYISNRYLFTFHERLPTSYDTMWFLQLNYLMNQVTGSLSYVQQNGVDHVGARKTSYAGLFMYRHTFIDFWRVLGCAVLIRRCPTYTVLDDELHMCLGVEYGGEAEAEFSKCPAPYSITWVRN